MTLTATSQAVPPRLERHFARLTRKRRSLGAPQIALRGPNRSFTYGNQVAAFHAASIGKLCTGVIIMQLIEEGHFTLNTSVETVLNPHILSGLISEEAPAPTVLDLLQHFSGIADYFEGNRKASVLKEVLADPKRAWTPQECLDFTRTHLTPVGRPGERFRYSDTGYTLLGYLIEEVTGRRYHEAVHERIIAPLSLTRTFLPGLSLPAEGDESIEPLYVSKRDMSTAPALSCAWAGGGIASTTNDLLTFSEALHQGTLIERRSYDVMTSIRGKMRAGIFYGAAMMELRFDGFSPLLRGRPRHLGHLGSTGTSLFFNPTTGAHLVMNFHSRRELSRLIRTAIMIDAFE